MRKINYKKYLSPLILIFIFLILPSFVFAADSGNKTFLLNVAIGERKDFTVGPNSNALGEYIKQWYGFLLGTIGIMATVMIMWGGFKYLTSRGDKGMIDGAKTNIISAITGVVLAFGTYTLLSLVNPALTTINMPGLSKIQGGDNVQLGSGGTSVNRQSPSRPQDIANRPADLAAAAQNGYINYGSMDIPAINPNANLSQYDKWFEQYGAQYGIDPDLLRAIAAAESHGDPTVISPAGAAGLMQFMPATASDLNGTAVTTQDLISNPELSIRLAAQYLSENPQVDQYDLIAGYNGGYSVTPTENSTPALAPSNDCPGARAYECGTNPGGLAETQLYVYNVTAYYNYYSGQ